MSKRIFLVILLSGLAAGLLQFSGVAWAQDPTIPTRTPTPDPNAPTATSVPSDPGQPPPTAVPPTADSGGGSNPQPTASPTIQTAATSTSPGSPSDPGGALATATTTAGGDREVAPGGTFVSQECGEQPFVVATDDVIVYAGPGLDYPVISTLQRPEIRPIIGRAQFAPWWQIEVTPDLVGWVFDDDVEEFGDTGSVPIVEAPDINGLPPTPGPRWDPTPIPFAACPATPTPTPTATATGEAGGEEAVVSGPLTSDDDGAGGDGGGPVSVTETGAVSVGGAELGSNSSAGLAKQLREEADFVPGSATASVTNSAGVRGFLLPLLGVGLIAAGVLLALVARGRAAGNTGSAGSGRAEDSS